MIGCRKLVAVITKIDVAYVMAGISRKVSKTQAVKGSPEKAAKAFF